MMIKMIKSKKLDVRSPFRQPFHLLISARFVLMLAVVVGLVSARADAVAAEKGVRKPNIVLILADDVGYSDVGCFGGEIHTPNVDRLAAEGLRFTQFYTNSVCITARASLLTGLYPRWRNPVRSKYLLAPNMVTIGEVLNRAGYQTALSGKWHMGHQAPHRPIDRGFDEYYGLLDGCCNYFNPAQRDPAFEGDSGAAGGGYRFWGQNDLRITEFPNDFYATDAITDHAVANIHRFSSKDQPFFLHVCYTAAHSPLHSKPEDIARYKGSYSMGWDHLRRQRYRRQIELGLIRGTWKLPPREPEVVCWEDQPNRDWQESLMEVYAAMVDSMDQSIGRILQALEDVGADDNTVVIYLSDNGGCAEQAGGDDPTNIPGPKEHYVSCGAGWANVQNTPFRRYKEWVHEGGIATGLIVRWPGVVKPNTISNQVGHVIDFMPTFVEIARSEYPATIEGQAIMPVEGKSLVPILRRQQRQGHDALYWEWSGSRAVRHGRWKLAWDSYVERWELYDLEADRTECNDLAQEQPDRVARMNQSWLNWADRTGVSALRQSKPRLKP